MKIYGEVFGTKELERVMGRVGNANLTPIGQTLLMCAYRVHQWAINSISRGVPRTGRLRPIKGHVRQPNPRRGQRMSSERSSAPGEPPKTDTGILVNSIYVKMDKGSGHKRTAFVGSRLLYAWWLELGTRRMRPRPWLHPAFESTRDANMRTMAAAIDQAVKDAAKGKGGGG